MTPATATLIGASLATAGWLYTARRARALSRKQHTVSVMLQANFNKEFQDAVAAIRPSMRAGGSPPDILVPEQESLYRQFRFILNHYEFIAAGLRNGDFDERLVRDSERSAIIQVFRACKPMIWSMRNDRSRMSIYEHLEWLDRRWGEKPPGKLQLIAEWCIARPFPSRRHNPHA